MCYLRHQNQSAALKVFIAPAGLPAYLDRVKPNQPKVLIPIGVLLVLLIFVGNYMTGGHPYSTKVEDLRAQFNRDKGKVRLLMLLAPS